MLSRIDITGEGYGGLQITNLKKLGQFSAGHKAKDVFVKHAANCQSKENEDTAA